MTLEPTEVTYHDIITYFLLITLETDYAKVIIPFNIEIPSSTNRLRQSDMALQTNQNMALSFKLLAKGSKFRYTNKFFTAIFHSDLVELPIRVILAKWLNKLNENLAIGYLARKQYRRDLFPSGNLFLRLVQRPVFIV